MATLPFPPHNLQHFLYPSPHRRRATASRTASRHHIITTLYDTPHHPFTSSSAPVHRGCRRLDGTPFPRHTRLPAPHPGHSRRRNGRRFHAGRYRLRQDDSADAGEGHRRTVAGRHPCLRFAPCRAYRNRWQRVAASVSRRVRHHTFVRQCHAADSRFRHSPSHGICHNHHAT